MTRATRLARMIWTRDVARRLAVFAVAVSLFAIPLGTGTGTVEAVEADESIGGAHDGAGGCALSQLF